MVVEDNLVASYLFGPKPEVIFKRPLSAVRLHIANLLSFHYPTQEPSILPPRC